MAELNHFAISAALGSMLGPRVPVHPGQIGSSELSATVAGLLASRKGYIDDLNLQDDLSKRYEKAVTRAFLDTREGFHPIGYWPTPPSTEGSSAPAATSGLMIRRFI